MNVCGACGRDFGSLTAFDKHRVGKHAYTYSEGVKMDPIREDGRRCLSVEELEAEGFVQNCYGRWTTRDSIKRGQEVLSVRLISAQRHPARDAA